MSASATTNLRSILKSQYHAALAMLGQTVDECTDELWTSEDYPNAFWQVAYHALYFTHLYLSPTSAEFVRWTEHREDSQNPDGLPGPPDPKSTLPLIPRPYTKEQVLRYWNHCEDMIDGALDAMDLDSPTCGFSWYKVSKLEHQFINIRHIQHHAAQLADRLRSKRDIGIRWAGARHPSRTLFHITSSAEADQAKRSGAYEPAAFGREGFIHCCYTRQVVDTANAKFSGRRDLVLLEIDRSTLSCEVREENLEGRPHRFPHIYGKLPMAAVVRVHEFPCDAEGRFKLPASVIV